MISNTVYVDMVCVLSITLQVQVLVLVSVADVKN